MGEVYLAQQISLDRKVALKTLSKEFSKNEDLVKRFIREARSMAKLNHPNIVQAYAVESLKGLHFCAIEFIDGKSLQDWLDELGKLSVGDALHVVIVCAQALQHAHDKNMIHRDIKPDNILVSNEGVVKVADFGLAKALDDDVSMTKSGTGMGTPLYMAPEQAKDAKRVDHRADIYALGATLYHLLTGGVPFKGKSTLELILAKEEGKFTPARQSNKDIPKNLDLMIDKMLQKNQDHRYASCSDMIADLTKLKLAHESLSFVTGATARLSTSRVEEKANAGTVISQTTAGGRRPSSRDNAERPKPLSAGTNPGNATRSGTAGGRTQGAATGDVWIVQYKNSKGKTSIKKLPSGEIRKALRNGKLSSTALVKRNTRDEFEPIARRDEFIDSVEQGAVTARNMAKTAKMESFYTKVEKAEKRRQRWRWLRNFFQALMGYASLLIWLAVIAAVGFGIYLFAPGVKSIIDEQISGFLQSVE